MASALAQERIYTIDDIYSLPDGERAELIDGRIYYMAPQQFFKDSLLPLLNLRDIKPTPCLQINPCFLDARK